MALMSRQPQKAGVQRERMPLLKKLFWAYFLLLIFEGAIRKWILPQFSGPLLLVRDPVAILIIWEAYRKNLWPRKWSLAVGMLSSMLIGLSIVQVVAGGSPWFVALYGLRSYLLPFPVAFIMGENLDAEDLRKFAICTLWLLLPLTLLEVVQYYQPADSIWNKGVTLGSVQLASSGGHVRASATFSYIAGPMSFLPMAAAFVVYGLARPGHFNKWLLWGACFALLLSVPVTGSRTVVILLAAMTVSMGIAALFGVSQFVRSVQVIVALVFVALLVSRLPVFSEASDTLADRFTEAADFEGGSFADTLIRRTADPMVGSIEHSLSTGDWLGTGMGYGAAAVAQLLTSQQFSLVGETEFERVIGEFGWPCGLAYLLFRLGLAATVTVKALAAARNNEPLAWLLAPLAASSIAFNIFEQPTEQGFFVIATALSIAAINGASKSFASQANLDPRLWRLPRRPGTQVDVVGRRPQVIGHRHRPGHSVP